MTCISLKSVWDSTMRLYKGAATCMDGVNHANPQGLKAGEPQQQKATTGC